MTRPELPPVVQLLLDESLHDVGSAHLFAAALKARGLRTELRRQAEYTELNWSYVDSTKGSADGRLIVAPTDSLNPLILGIKCPNAVCRTVLARKFARSIGLYADEAILPDVFTGRLLNPESPLSELAGALYGDLEVLRELLPFVESGAAVFGKPSHHFCPGCNAALNGDVPGIREVARAIAEDAKVLRVGDERGKGPSIKFEVPSLSRDFGSGHFTVDLDRQQARLFKALLPRGRGSKIPKAIRSFIADCVLDDVRILVQGLVGESLSAQNACAVLAGASTLERLILQGLESDARYHLNKWEMEATLQLPWVSDLSVSEVVRLKEEARHALPRLRVEMAKRLASEDGKSPEKIENLLLDLSEQAAAVEAELEACKNASTSLIRIGAGALGLGLAVYGGLTLAGVGQPAAAGTAAVASTAISSLVTVLNAAEEEKLKIQPGYVLVKAKELLSHRH